MAYGLEAFGDFYRGKISLLTDITNSNIKYAIL
jgi:hypothetical protein